MSVAVGLGFSYKIVGEELRAEWIPKITSLNTNRHVLYWSLEAIKKDSCYYYSTEK